MILYAEMRKCKFSKQRTQELSRNRTWFSSDLLFCASEHGNQPCSVLPCCQEWFDFVPDLLLDDCWVEVDIAQCFICIYYTPHANIVSLSCWKRVSGIRLKLPYTIANASGVVIWSNSCSAVWLFATHP